MSLFTEGKTSTRMALEALVIVQMIFSVACHNKFASNPPSPATTPEIAAGQEVVGNDSSEIPEDIQKIISEEVSPLVDASGADSTKSPGMMVAVVSPRGSGTMGFGTTVVGGNEVPNGDTLFGVGSVSKAFAGILLAHNKVTSRLTLSQSAYGLLPSSIATYFDKNITLKHLVTHYSGLKSMPENVTAFRDLDRDGKNDAVPWSPGRNYGIDLLKQCLSSGQCKPQSTPGNQYLYSNLGIGILGIVLANKLGYATFDQVMKAQLTGPLGMTSTGVTDNLTFMSSIPKNRFAQGYDANMVPRPMAEMGILNAAGGVVTSGNDLVKLLKALTGLNQTSLAPAIAEATTALDKFDNGDIGYAIEISEMSSRYTSKCATTFGNFKIYVKPGSTPVNTAYMLWHKESSTGLAFLSNKGSLSAITCMSAKALNRILNL